MMPSSVARLHRALVDAMRRHRPSASNGPVTIAEIYQDLVPYRSVRSALGFALNADYEHALLQLLAGVEGRARVEPAEAREALRLELESPNPNTGVFRGYAACDVWVATLDEPEAALDAGTDEPEAHIETGWSTPADVLHAVPVEPQRATPRQPAAQPEAIPLQTAPVSGYAATARAASPSSRISERVTATDASTEDESQLKPCHHCNRQLPQDRAVHFCPFCGKDQQRRCATCGEVIEPKWHFCVACGHSVG